MPNPQPQLPPEDQDPQVMQVKVVNRNDFMIRDMFDGVPYEFEPNKPTSVPIDAAHHIFGWWPPYTDQEGNRHEVDQKDMKRHIMKRFGWNTPAMQAGGKADMFYEALVIQPIIYRMVPVEVDDAPKGRPARAEARA